MIIIKTRKSGQCSSFSFKLEESLYNFNSNDLEFTNC